MAGATGGWCIVGTDKYAAEGGDYVYAGVCRRSRRLRSYRVRCLRQRLLYTAAAAFDSDRIGPLKDE